MNRKSVLLGLLLAVAVALAAWLLLAREPESPAQAAGAVDVPDTTASRGAAAASRPESAPSGRVAALRSVDPEPGTAGDDRAAFGVLTGRVAQRIQGKVQGRIAGAQLRVYPWTNGERVAAADHKPLASARSDAEGRFTLTGLPWAMRFLVQLEAPGFATAWHPLHRGTAFGGEQFLWMDAVATVRGRVTRGPAHEPVAGVEIECTNGTQRQGPITVRSDAQGGFELATALGFLQLIVRPPGELPETRRVLAVEGQVLELQLGLRRVVSGEVVDLVAGFPVAGASIAGHVETDRAGRFEFATSEPQCQVKVAAPGYASASAVLSGASPVRQRIALLREAAVTGTVRDADGQPVAGASVVLALWQQALRDRDQLSVAAMYGKCGKVPPPPSGANKVLEPALHEAVRTDAQGRFHIPGVGAGAGVVVCRVLVSCAGFADAESPLLEVPFPGGSAAVDLVLHRAACVHGTVRMNGVPNAARVQIDAAAGLHLEVCCDAQGRYLFAGVPAGDALVEAIVESLAPVREQRSLLVRAGAQQELDFDLRPHAATIRGEVVVRGGLGSSGLATAVEERSDGARRYHAPIDAQGRFAIPVPDDPSLRFTLAFGSAGSRAQGGRTGVRAGEDVGLLQAARLCAVCVKLQDASTRAPLDLGRCFVRPHDTDAWQEVTGRSAPRSNPHVPSEVWLPWGLLDLRVEPASAEHAPVEHMGLTVHEHVPWVTLLAPRR